MVKHNASHLDTIVILKRNNFMELLNDSCGLLLLYNNNMNRNFTSLLQLHVLKGNQSPDWELLNQNVQDKGFWWWMSINCDY